METYSTEIDELLREDDLYEQEQEQQQKYDDDNENEQQIINEETELEDENVLQKRKYKINKKKKVVFVENEEDSIQSLEEDLKKSDLEPISVYCPLQRKHVRIMILFVIVYVLMNLPVLQNVYKCVFPSLFSSDKINTMGVLVFATLASCLFVASENCISKL